MANQQPDPLRNPQDQGAPAPEESHDPHDHPDVPILPPFIYLGFLLAAMLLDWGIPLDAFGWGFQFAMGILLICAGAGILTYCVMGFTRAGTNVPPNKPATALVTEGPYNFSRNPIYISMVLIYLGLCFLFDLVWGFPLLIPLIYVINTYVIEREEGYLEKKFGEQYLAYKEKVKRWF